MTLLEIATLLNGKLIGNGELSISRIAPLEEAKEGDIVCIFDPKLKKYVRETKASAIVIGKEVDEKEIEGKNVIFVENPFLAFLKLLELFEEKEVRKGIFEPNYIAKDAKIGRDVTIYPFVFVDSGTRIEEGVKIYPFVSIGKNVIIGKGSKIYSNVTIYDRTVIGRGVVIHGGSVIGSDGFGYFFDGERHRKIPQIGNVVIEDEVEIGANVTIDRATIGSTIIRKGVKIDNLVQIAHNVEIGENSIIVAQVGIAGSVKIGKNVILSGQVGVKDHVRIGNNVKASGKTGITKDVKDGEIVSGTPHMAHEEWKKLQFYIKRLPFLFEKVKEMEKKLKGERNDRD